MREVTRFAFSTTDERLRIEALTLLDGVSFPTASAVLHLLHQTPYPLLDYRALGSLNTAVPSTYKYELWNEYVVFCRALAKRAGVTMRTLDKALWQFHKERR